MVPFSGRIGIRTPGTLSGTPVFKTGAINQLCHSSFSLFRERKSTTFHLHSQKIEKKIFLIHVIAVLIYASK